MKAFKAPRKLSEYTEFPTPAATKKRKRCVTDDMDSSDDDSGQGGDTVDLASDDDGLSSASDAFSLQPLMDALRESSTTLNLVVQLIRSQQELHQSFLPELLKEMITIRELAAARSLRTSKSASTLKATATQKTPPPQQ